MRVRTTYHVLMYLMCVYVKIVRHSSTDNASTADIAVFFFFFLHHRRPSSETKFKNLTYLF